MSVIHSDDDLSEYLETAAKVKKSVVCFLHHFHYFKRFFSTTISKQDYDANILAVFKLHI